MTFLKRGIMLLLSLSLVVGTMAGCGSKDSAQEADSSKATTSSDSKDSGKDTVKKEEPVVLKVITHEGKKPSEDSKVYKVFKEKLNVELDIIETTTDNRKEKVNIMLATGDIPDLFFASVDPTSDEMQKWMKQDLILAYDEYLGDYPNIKSQLEKFSKITKLTNDQYFMLPIQRQIGEFEYVNDHTFWVRKDYMDNLGLDMPKTFEEFNDLLYALTFDDPDQNGVNDTFGLTIDNAWWLYGIYNMFGASEKYFYEKDGKWEAEAVSQNMKDAVTYINKLYADGVIDPEFMIKKSGRVYENFISGKAGMMFKNGGVHYNIVYDQFKDAYPEKDPKNLFTWLPITTGVNGKPARLDGGANYWGATYIGNTGDAEKVKKSLEVIDFLASQEGQDLFFYGIEGEHYTLDGNNKQSTIPDLQSVFDYDKHGHLGHMAVWLDGLFTESVANREECKASYQDSMNAVYGDPLLYTDLGVDPTVKKTLKEYTREKLTELIIQSTDLDKDWDKYVEGWKDAGGAVMTEAVNAKAN